MKYSRNAIYNYVEGKVNTLVHPVYCTSAFEPIPSHYPSCYIRQMNSYREKQNVTLANDDEQGRSVWNVTVYTNDDNGALESAYTIAGYADGAFENMMFLRTSQQEEITNVAGVYRVVSRYERVIGGEDTMPTN